MCIDDKNNILKIYRKRFLKYLFIIFENYSKYLNKGIST